MTPYRPEFPRGIARLALIVALCLAGLRATTLHAALADMVLTSPPAPTGHVYLNTAAVPLQFSITSDSAYTSRWFKDGVELVASTKYEIAGGLLRIRNIAYSDEGHYQLRVTNASGTANSLIIWILVHEPLPDPEIVVHPQSANLEHGAYLQLGVQLAAPGTPVLPPTPQPLPSPHRFHQPSTAACPI